MSIQQHATEAIQSIPESTLELLLPLLDYMSDTSDLSDDMKQKEAHTIRNAGKYHGKIWMSDDFDAPLEEFEDYM